MYWVIEPHVDDAFLSLHQHMKDWVKAGQDVTILTVFSTPQRRLEGVSYAKKVGVGYDYLRGFTGMGGLNSCEPDLSGLQIPSKQGDQVILPLGLQHPDHRAVAALDIKQPWYYVEIPYQSKLKLGAELQERLGGKSIVSMRFASARKWRHVELFKSQAKFYYFNKPNIMHKIPELIVKECC